MSFFALLSFFQFFEHFSVFLFHLFSFNIFPYFLSSLFSLFTFSFHLFVHLFLLFSPFSSLSHFSILSFYLYLCLCFSFSLWQRTKHVIKRNEWSQWWEWSPMSEKEVSCWRIFSTWTKVSVDGPESTKESALADDFWLGLAAIVCFLWLNDFCVTQTARGTSAGECLSSSPNVLSLSTFTLFMITLLPQHVAKSYWKDWATWGGEAEPGRFDGLCRRSKKEDRARKTKICGKATQRLRRGNKQTGR